MLPRRSCRGRFAPVPTRLASPLLSGPLVVPTIHDVIGAPVPGLAGLRPSPRPNAVQFQQLLQQLLGTPASATAKPVSLPAPPSRLAPGAAPRFRPLPRMTTPLRRWPASTAAPVPGRVAPRSTAAAPHAASRGALASAIRQAAATAGVEPALSVGVARVESNLNPAARSPDGASHGTFQVTRATAAEMRRRFASGAVARPSGSDDVALGVGNLRSLNDLFARPATLGRGVSTTPIADAGERKLFAVAAFNAGEGRVAQAQAHARAAGEDPTRFANVRGYLPASTQTYVDRVSTFAREEAGATRVA
jgi:hypothetical protein